MWIHEERDALAVALGIKQGEIVRLEVFLRIFDRASKRKA